jgi:hypothetical protein
MDVDLPEAVAPSDMAENEGSERSYSSSISSLGCQGGDFPVDMPKLRDGEETEEPGKDNDDETAMMMTKLLSASGRFNRKEATFGMSLLKRATIVESIKWLGRHIPGCALHDICKYVVKMQDRELDIKPMMFPHVTKYQAALLFIDMSGFTKLSQSLDVESLSKVSLIFLSYNKMAITENMKSHNLQISLLENRLSTHTFKQS